MPSTARQRSRILPALLALLPLAAHAVETGLDEIIVSASKLDIPLNATGVDAADLQFLRASTSDTARLLSNVPGVSLQGAGGVSSLPAIHGLADDRLRIKVDGMDLIASCPNHMNPALSYLDPGNVGLLKVFAGITPVSVGGDSIGGTIVAETPAPAFAASGQGRLVKGEAGTFYRSNGNARGGNVAATYATESISLTYSGAMSQADNYKAGSPFKSRRESGRIGHTLALDEVGSTAFKTVNHTLGLALKHAHHLFEARLGYQDMPYQLWPNQRMDLLGNTQYRLNLRYLGRFDRGSLELRAYRETVEHFMDFGDDKRYWYGPNSGGGGAVNPVCTPSTTQPDCAWGMPMHTRSKTDGASVKADMALSDESLLRLGGELQRYRLDDGWPASGGGMWPNTFWNINDGKRDRAALFAEWEAQVGPQWLTLLGARYEHVRSDAGPVQAYNNAVAPATTLVADFNQRSRSRRDGNLDVTALARYQHDAGLDIEFGVARKVRSPNLHERYGWFSRGMEMLMVNWFGDGNGYIGNRNLKPEKAHTLSATFDWHAPQRTWEFKATPYYTRVSDYIDVVRCPPSLGGSCTAANRTASRSFVFLQFANQAARLYGIDLSGHMPLARTAWGEWGLKGLMTYTNGKNPDTGDDLYNIMPLNARLTLTHKYGGWDNGLEVVAVKAKNNVSAVRNEVRTPGYGLVNLRASHSWKHTRIDFGIENLFDKHYDLPLGGAYLGQGTTMTTMAAGIAPRWGVVVPGMGRSIHAGINVKF